MAGWQAGRGHNSSKQGGKRASCGNEKRKLGVLDRQLMPGKDSSGKTFPSRLSEAPSCTVFGFDKPEAVFFFGKGKSGRIVAIIEMVCKIRTHSSLGM